MGVSGIDHVPIATPDLERTRARLRRLGFALTPTGTYRVADPTGVVHEDGPRWPNACVMFQETWLDVLEHEDLRWDRLLPTRCVRPVTEAVQGVALACDDVSLTRAELLERGIEVGRTYDLLRRRDPGTETPPAPSRLSAAQFRLFGLGPGEIPGLAASVIRRLDSEPDRTPGWLEHGNGATDLAGVVLAIPDDALDDTVVRLAQLHLACTLDHSEGQVTARVGRQTLRYLTPTAVEKRLGMFDLGPLPVVIALEIATRDTARSAAYLQASGVPFRATPAGPVVEPDAGPGCALAFVHARG